MQGGASLVDRDVGVSLVLQQERDGTRLLTSVVRLFGPTALRGERPVKISTTCTVFAESEVLSWLGKGKKIEDILLGVHESIAARSIGLLRRVGIEEQVTFTGGVARNVAMVQTLNERLGVAVNVSEDSHFMGALGAALFARDHIVASREPGARREVSP